MTLDALKFFDRFIGFALILLGKRTIPSNPQYPRRILAIKLSAMGDILCLLPSIRALKNALPSAQIDILTTARTQPELYNNLWFIGSTYVLPTTLLSSIRFLLAIIWNARKYDLIIDFDQSYRISEFIGRMGQVNAGFKTKLKGNTVSLLAPYRVVQNEKLMFAELSSAVAQLYDKTLPTLSLYLPELTDHFSPSPALRKAHSQILQQSLSVVFVYPGSSPNAQFRRWGWPNYEELSRLLTRCTEHPVVFAGGPDEIGYKKELLLNTTSAIDWINRWSLSEWAWIFLNTPAIFVGSDGGLYHLADLTGLQSVAIFGPSTERKWGSLMENSVMIKKSLSCRPCIMGADGRVPQKCWKGNTECLTSIQPIDVFREVMTLIKRTTK